MRTVTQSGTRDPTWEQEFVLFGAHGLEGAAALRIKIKDPGSGTALYCTVLHCTVLYCTALYCTVLYCTVLY